MTVALLISGLGTLLIYGSLEGHWGGTRFVVGIASMYVFVALATIWAVREGG